MSLTLLQMAQSVVKRLPLTTVPESVVGNNDPGTQQLLEIFQEEGDELRSKSEWAPILQTWTFTITTSPQSEPFEDDYDRLRVQTALWRSGSNLVSLSGPISPNDWHWLVSVPGTYPGYWRPFGSGLQVLGVPTGETVTTEYVSRNWILDQDGTTTKAVWGEDTDTSLLPDGLIMAGVRWRWKQSKGLEYAEDMATYERELERRIAADRLARPVHTSRPYRGGLPPTWPGQVTT